MKLFRTLGVIAAVSVVLGMFGCSQKESSDESHEYSSDSGQPQPQADFTATESIEDDCNKRLLDALPNKSELEGAKLSYTQCGYSEATRVWEKPEAVLEITLTDSQAQPSAVVAASPVGEMSKKTLAIKFGMTKQGVQMLVDSRAVLLEQPAALSALGGEGYLPFIYEFAPGDLAAVGVNRGRGADNLLATYKNRYVIEVERSDRELYDDNRKAEAAYKPLFDMINLTALN